MGGGSEIVAPWWRYLRRRGAVGEATRRTSRRKRRSCLQSTEIPYDLFRLSRRSRCLCCYCCLFPRSGRGWLGVHLGIEGGSCPLMWRQPRSRDSARRERDDQSQCGNARGEAQPSADVGGLPCRDDGGLGGLGGHTRTRRVRRPGPCRESAGGRLSRLRTSTRPVWAATVTRRNCGRDARARRSASRQVVGNFLTCSATRSSTFAGWASESRYRQSLAFINGSMRVIARIRPRNDDRNDVTNAALEIFRPYHRYSTSLQFSFTRI